MRRRIDFVIILALDLLILAAVVVSLAAPRGHGRVRMHSRVSQAPAALRVKVWSSTPAAATVRANLYKT
jgi:hypothetical protein